MREKDPKKVQKIFDATLSLVFHEGLDAINISKIAKSAKVASGTLYIYFENKEILLNELFDHVTDLWIDNIKLSVDSPDLEDHFRSVWKNHILFALNHYKAMHFKNIFIHSKYLDENNQEKSTKFLERFYSVFDEAKEKGIIRNLDSQLIFSLLENITLQVIRFLMNEPSEKAKQETIENSFWLCWNGLKTI